MKSNMNHRQASRWHPKLGGYPDRPAFSTPTTASADSDGFRAIGTIGATSCILMLTYKKWQSPGLAGGEMRPNPRVRRAAECPRCDLV